MTDLTYKKLKEDHLDKINNHLLEVFFAREPLGIALNATDPSLIRDWLPELTSAYVKLQASVGCFDGDNVIGAAVNSILHKNASHNVPSIKDILEARDKSHPLLKIFQFMEEEVYNDVDVFANTDTILYVCFLSVDPKYGGRRIGTRLLELSEEEARRQGIREIVVETTGKYSARIFEKSGYSNVKCVPYKDTKATIFHNLGDHTAANLWRKMM